MMSKYFCTGHWQIMHESEIDALICWTQLMKRGNAAYAECRIDQAEEYLEACFDIANMRLLMKRNVFFKHLHITKPAELLIEVFDLNNHNSQAEALLNKLTNTTNINKEKVNDHQFQILSTLRKRISLITKNNNNVIPFPHSSMSN